MKLDEPRGLSASEDASSEAVTHQSVSPPPIVSATDINRGE
jgi:hypothetical protein